MRHYYIYYRVPQNDQPELKERVRNMQANLKSVTGIAGKLLARHDDPAIWMEIYDDVSDPTSFEIALSAAVDKFDISAFLEADQSRKTECFESF